MFGKKETQPDLEFYTVYDSKSKSYAEPFPAQNKEVLLRDFANAFRKPEAWSNNKYLINAEDYAIFRIGTFDQQSGKLEAINAEHVANLHDIRAMASPAPMSPDKMGIVHPT